MALEVFNYPYHSTQTENPESGFRGVMGKSYIFTAPPTDPDQRKFVLDFTTMKFFLDSEGDLTEDTEPEINMYNLINFYQRHKLYKSFQYQHPVHGLLEVKFNKPLMEPYVLPGGTGAVKAFTVELIEIP